MEKFLQALPIVASHPLALLGYLAVVIAWLVVALQTRKANKLFDVIKSLPPQQRLKAIELEYRTAPRSGLSAEQWLQSRKMSFIFAGFAITLFTILVLVAFALIPSSDTRASPPLIRGIDENVQSPVFGAVQGNVYITYQEAVTLTQPISPSTQVLFVSEDVRGDHTGFNIRFTAYNNGESKIKIYDFKTIKYAEQQTVFYYMGPRIFLYISPENPFIGQDVTFEIEPRDSLSFNLRYEFKTDGGGIRTIFGVVAFYHTPSGESRKLKSNKLIVAQPQYSKYSFFDSETALSIFQVTDPAYLSSFQNSFYRLMLDALVRHTKL